MTAEAIALQNGLYIEALQDIAPEVLTAATAEVIRENDRFPVPHVVRKVAEAIADKAAASRALANPNPDAPENFLARCKRVGNIDAFWMRAHHDMLWPLFDDHCTGRLRDEYLATCITAAGNWQTAQPERFLRSSP